jgi:hypothetical protein
MTKPLNETTETLLGRQLLGCATSAEILELQQRREESATLQDALEWLELSQFEYERSTLWHESAERKVPLPGFAQCEHLARSMRRWERIGLTVACAAAAVLVLLLASALVRLDGAFEAWKLAVVVLTSAAGIGIVLRIAGRRHRGMPYAKAKWSELVARLEADRNRYQGSGPAQAMFSAAMLAPILFVASVMTPQPFSRALAYASFACMAFAVHVAVRRWKLRFMEGA